MTYSFGRIEFVLGYPIKQERGRLDAGSQSRTEWLCGCYSTGPAESMVWKPCTLHTMYADGLDETKSSELLSARGDKPDMRFGEYKAVWSFDPSNSFNERQLRYQYLSILHACGKPAGDYFAAELIYRELIGNAVRHAPGTVEVELRWSERYAVLSIDDQWDPFLWSGTTPANPLNEHGRGLYLVNFFARELRIKDSHTFGFKISAVLPVERKSDTANLFDFPEA